MRLVPLVLIGLQLLVASALPHRGRIPDVLKRARQQKKQRREGSGGGGAENRLAILQAEEDDAAAADASDVVTSYFEQCLDHFSDDRKDGGKQHETFQQRYFYTGRYVRDDDQRGRPANTVAFLCVGGEGPSLDESVLVNSVHCTGDMIGLAAKLFEEHDYDVHLFALEHRFYGESFPSQKSSAVNLRGGDGAGGEDEEDESFEVHYAYLSSRQAVQDVAAFVQSDQVLKIVRPSHDPAEKPVRWITFGGSYPGMLSAWSHLLHPNAIFAAVSSSAPVQAKLDFHEYYEHVGSDLGDEDVGGSELCRTIVEEGHAQVAAVLDNGRAGESFESDLGHVAELFDVCDGAKKLRESRRNQEAFLGDGLIRIPAQTNDPSCEGELCNIEKLCLTIVGERKSNPEKSSMEILAKVRKLDVQDQCDEIDWESYLEWWKTPTRSNANDRSWLYQTCSEFGFYQTCNRDSSCPYGRGYHEISQDLEICQVIFGIKPHVVKENVESTLTYYGGRSLIPSVEGGLSQSSSSGMLESGEQALDGQKHLIFVTGDVDPWTDLAVIEGTESHPSLSVRGASHHFWTHEIKDSDGEFVIVARQTIYNTISGWLEVSGRQAMNKRLDAAAIDVE